VRGLEILGVLLETVRFSGQSLSGPGVGLLSGVEGLTADGVHSIPAPTIPDVA